MKSEISCGCLIQYKTHFLMLKNKNGQWTIPKGHKKAHESIFTTAARETKEESGITVKVDETRWAATNFIITEFNTFKTVVLFHAQIIEEPTVLVSKEHIGFQWVTKQELIDNSHGLKIGKAITRLLKKI